MSRVILGSFEKVVLPEWGMLETTAKVDTGAFSGALHCSSIEFDETTRLLTFYPTSQSKHRIETDKFETRTVRSAHGHKHTRYLVPVVLELRGKKYKTTIGLTDRSSMKYEMLIGRRFLREHNMTVDVRINGEHDNEWKRVNI